MPSPLVIAHHLIWTTYGSWLPNDPRGSMSRTIRNNILTSIGQIHLGRKKVQPTSPEIRNFHQVASPLLKHPVRTFGAKEIEVIANAFAATISTFKYTCYACAIMPDHVHLVIRKHKHLAEEMIRNFQRESISRYAATNCLALIILCGAGRDGRCSWMSRRISGA